jgi:peptidoglycan/xylan/chitin deacetylase (PgdA/CDA1 family)
MKPVPVLMYHHIAADREITPAGFEKHLKYFASTGCTTPTLSDFLAFLKGEKSLQEKSLLLTFDDGYADNWICAYPLLKKYGFRAMVFATTGRMGDFAPRPTLADGAQSPVTVQGERGEQGFLSWQELKMMADSGVFEIGSHTETHNNFDKNAKWPDMAGELERSAKTIEEKTGVKPVAVAWPWGHVESHFNDAAKKAGYSIAFTTHPGANVPGTDPFCVRRFKMKIEDIDWLKRRLWLYKKEFLAEIYGSTHGLDRKIKNKLLGRD